MDLVATVARVVFIVLAVVAGVGYVVAELALWHVAGRLRTMSEELGGKPPRRSVLWALFWREPVPEPEFWDYIRAQCWKPGTEKLRDTMRTAEVLLTIRAVRVGLCVLFVMAMALAYALR